MNKTTDDLISRTTAIKICKSIVPNTNPDFYNLRSKAGYGSWMHSNGEACAATNIEIEIEKLPVVNTAPVVHGQWIVEKPDDYLDPRMRCSICSGIETPFITWRYCPYCGARMDAKNE